MTGFLRVDDKRQALTWFLVPQSQPTRSEQKQR